MRANASSGDTSNVHGGEYESMFLTLSVDMQVLESRGHPVMVDVA